MGRRCTAIAYGGPQVAQAGCRGRRGGGSVNGETSPGTVPSRPPAAVAMRVYGQSRVHSSVGHPSTPEVGLIAPSTKPRRTPRVAGTPCFLNLAGRCHSGSPSRPRPGAPPPLQLRHWTRSGMTRLQHAELPVRVDADDAALPYRVRKATSASPIPLRTSASRAPEPIARTLERRAERGLRRIESDSRSLRVACRRREPWSPRGWG